MFFKAENYRHPAFMEAVRDVAPQAPGLAAWGLMTGVAMVNSGLSVFESIAMTLFVYAGSSQLAALPLIAAGAPAWVIVATGFCVNLRFMVFSLHLTCVSWFSVCICVNTSCICRALKGWCTAISRPISVMCCSHVDLQILAKTLQINWHKQHLLQVTLA
ncbi:MAG: inner membrane protein YgaZ [Pseudomonadota bacterium]